MIQSVSTVRQASDNDQSFFPQQPRHEESNSTERRAESKNLWQRFQQVFGWALKLQAIGKRRMNKTQPIIFLTCVVLISCHRKGTDQNKSPALNDEIPDVCIKDKESLNAGCLKASTEIVLDVPAIPSLCGPDEAKQVYFCPDSILGFVRNWGYKYNLTVLRKHYEYAKDQQIDDATRSYDITKLVKINSTVDASSNLIFNYSKSWSISDFDLSSSFIGLFIDQNGKTLVTDGTRSINSKEYVCATEKHCNDLIAYSIGLKNKEEVAVCGARLDFRFQESASLPMILTSLSFFPCIP